MKKIMVFVSVALVSITLAGASFAKEFTIKELSTFDGKNGHRAYIAVDGKVYDVSDNSDWKNGVHTPTQGKLKAGIDATDIIGKSPHGKAVLKELPEVGTLVK